jgi:hypothetical protein
MYLSFHLEFKICCIHIFSKRKLVYFLFFNYITFGSDTSYSNLQRSSTRSFDIGRALKSVNLIQSSLDCRTNVEQFNHQCFERSAMKQIGLYLPFPSDLHLLGD